MQDTNYGESQKISEQGFGNIKILGICDFNVFPVPVNKVYLFTCFFKDSGIIGKFRIIFLLVCFLYQP